MNSWCFTSWLHQEKASWTIWNDRNILSLHTYQGVGGLCCLSYHLKRSRIRNIYLSKTTRFLHPATLYFRGIGVFGSLVKISDVNMLSLYTRVPDMLGLVSFTYPSFFFWLVSTRDYAIWNWRAVPLERRLPKRRPVHLTRDPIAPLGRTAVDTAWRTGGHARFTASVLCLGNPETPGRVPSRLPELFILYLPLALRWQRDHWFTAFVATP